MENKKEQKMKHDWILLKSTWTVESSWGGTRKEYEYWVYCPQLEISIKLDKDITDHLGLEAAVDQGRRIYDHARKLILAHYSNNRSNIHFIRARAWGKENGCIFTADL